MDNYENLSSSKVAIVGLGLMGGSMVLALRNKCKALMGIDQNLKTLERVQELRLIEHLCSQPDEHLSEADLVILATPILSILSFIKKLPEIHNGTPVIIDLGSTKSRIVEAMQELPERFDPIGGHPMCGSEKSSFVYADPELYRGANFVLTPLERTRKRGRQMAVELVKAVGAKPVWIEADNHDRMVAWTSHVPYLIANALCNAIPDEATAVIGPGFRSTSRLSGSSIKMMADILQTNRENIMISMHEYMKQLSQILEYVQQEEIADLIKILEMGKYKYEELLESPEH